MNVFFSERAPPTQKKKKRTTRIWNSRCLHGLWCGFGTFLKAFTQSVHLLNPHTHVQSELFWLTTPLSPFYLPKRHCCDMRGILLIHIPERNHHFAPKELPQVWPEPWTGRPAFIYEDFKPREGKLFVNTRDSKHEFKQDAELNTCNMIYWTLLLCCWLME